MSVSTVLAKALFDNTAESPEELAFRKGDILMVLEQEQNGGPGWWLCSLHGRQGIAPANRLRLLQTAPAPGADSVYLSPGRGNEDDAEAVYRTPPAAGGNRGAGGTSRSGELRKADGGRPRSHSSSGSRPRPDWDLGSGGRPRSPSLRGRGTDVTGALYQSPASPLPSSGRQPRAQKAHVGAVEDSEDTTYLVPRESLTGGHAEDCYLVPKGTPLASEDVYQSPTGGVVANGAPQSKDGPGMYQTPSSVAVTLQRTSSSSGQAPPRPLLKGPSPGPTAARGQAVLACHRGSPLLVRAGHPRVPGSPNFTRKPPPPAPPVRGVTRKDGQQLLSTDGGTAPEPGSRDLDLEKSNGKGESYLDPVDDQVYDTPPSGRWQRAVLGNDDDGIYDTPRALPVDPETEVYDIPTITLNGSAPEVLASATPPDDVYSVPTLPGVPPGESAEEAVRNGPANGVPASEKRASAGDSPDCGIYDMPALTSEALPHSSSSSSTSTRRLSVSSNGSGDVQWRASLSGSVHAVLGAVSCSPAALSSRDLATSLAEILSTWKASHSGDPPPPLQQAWARLSDLLPALSAVGNAPPSEGLLSLVQRSLEESGVLLQAQGRPRLPSQESLSRRPLPALPGSEGKPAGGGMGSRKSSWIQERPLPPTPQPAFPTPPTQAPGTLLVGRDGGDEDPGNEYAGIGLTPIPAPVQNGDSVGYVKLQLTPSPPLPASLSLEDSELLSFYSSQSLAHLSCLADAIDVLFASVRGNQPPRVFVARGKSLIVTAHKLVFIGDTLSRLLASADLRAKITTSGGGLCQALKAVVVATKGAAQNYPSVSASQEMVDRVAELSQQAAGFSTLLQRLAEISS
ncbi:embryonal Fyn-associated substrate isoform X2 [Stigmatopora nigra]